MRVDILLSTYNGEAYLDGLIKSIINQDYHDFRLLIRDDASTDSTTNIIKKYKLKYPNKIDLIDTSLDNLGASKSFSLLAAYSKSNYIMFCDQDDIWMKNKLRLTLNKMQESENNNSNRPILIHSDLTVVNQDLHILSKSFWSFQKINPNRNNISQLLVQNVVTGCTIMINKKLLELILPFPDGIVMHDWWVALVASVFGCIDFLPSPTIFYRQHNQNSIGASKYGFNKWFDRLLSIDLRKRESALIINQAQIFYKRYEKSLPLKEKLILEKFIEIVAYNPLIRGGGLYRNNYTKNGFVRQIIDIILPL